MSFTSRKLLNSSKNNLIWNSSNVPAGGDWSSVTYGDGKFVAVSAGSKNVIAYSEDNAITWNVVNLEGYDGIQWSSVTYGNGIFVAVHGNFAAYSLDAITWSVVTVPQASWISVTFGGGKFVAVSSKATMYSDDGITWNIGSLQGAQSYNLTSVAYGSGRFVAVSAYTNFSTIHSFDGITWIEPKLLYYENWTSVTFGNGTFVAVSKDDAASGNTTIAMYSGDGITWTYTTIPGGRGDYRSVIYGGNKFVAVGTELTINSTYRNNVFAYSTNGITWFNASVPAEWQWGFNSVTYGNGRFVAISYTSNFHAYSNDGINWTIFNLLSEFSLNLVYGGNKFVGILESSFSNHVLYSYDGINWNLIQPLRIDYWRSITYGNGKFVAVSPERTAYSLDGITWTETTPPVVLNDALRGIVYGNGMFVLVGNNKWYYSVDGINWNINNNFLAPTNSSTPIYGNNTFIRLPNVFGNGFYSNDGINWTSFSSNRWCRSAVYEGGKFVCHNSTIPSGSINNVTSFISNTTDFVNFNDNFIRQPPDDSWSNIAYGSGIFVIFYVVDFLLTSKNSINWKKEKLPVIYAVASTLSFGDNKFLASFQDGTVKYAIV